MEEEYTTIKNKVEEEHTMMWESDHHMLLKEKAVYKVLCTE